MPGLEILWWALRDSNPEPRDYESPALTVAPRALMYCDYNFNNGNSFPIGLNHDLKYYHAQACRTTHDQAMFLTPRYSLILKMYHKTYHWMGIVQAIIPSLIIELTIGELVPFQNYVGLRDWTRTGRPYPAFRGIHKSSTCGFDFTDYAMLGGSRPGPVNRHGFEIAGRTGTRSAPIMGPAPAGRPLSGWRPALRKRITAVGVIRDVPRAAERRGGGNAAARGTRPAGRIGHRGPLALEPVPRPRPRRRKFFRNCPCIAARVPV